MLNRYFQLLTIAGIVSGMAQAQPVITAVQDGAAYTPNIAQGSVFVVKGTGLSAPGFVQAPSLPLATALNNVSISFAPVGGGGAIESFMVYTYNVSGVNQLAAVLPSTVAVGEYDVTVSNGGQRSAPVRARVVDRKPGIVTADGSGSGPAQATTAGYDLIRFTTGRLGTYNLTPVQAGDAVILWGTGLGSDTRSDPTGESSGDVTAAAQVRVLIGNMEVVPFFAGRAAGLPGTDQINFHVPAGTAPGCAVPVQVRANGVLSNLTSIAVAESGRAACTSPSFSEEQLRTLSTGGSILGGVFSFQSIRTFVSLPGLDLGAVSSESLYGGFTRFTANRVAEEGMALRAGQCNVWQRQGTASEITFGEVTYETLDAGPRLTAGGPGFQNREVPKLDARISEYYTSFTTGIGSTPALVAGQYSLTGPGGTDVGPFTASVTLPAFQWTNQSAITAIPRNQPLVINWTGGTPGWVEINGFGGRIASGNALDPENAVVEATVFSCIANASAGTLTVPVSILQQLPPVAALNPLNPASSEVGMLGVYAVRDGGGPNFAAPLTAGGTVNGYLGYILGDVKLIAIQ